MNIEIRKFVRTTIAMILMGGLASACVQSANEEDQMAAALLLADTPPVENFETNTSEINGSWRHEQCGSEPGNYERWKTGTYKPFSKYKDALAASYPSSIAYVYYTDKEKGKTAYKDGVCQSWVPYNGRNYLLFQNGASGQPIGNPPEQHRSDWRGYKNYSTWGKFMHDAAVMHDHCYHHGARTYGRTRKQCDQYFKWDIEAKCRRVYNSGSKRNRCLRNAGIAYSGVRGFGLAAFNSFDTFAPYLESNHIVTKQSYEFKNKYRKPKN